MAEKVKTTPEGINFGKEGAVKDVRQMCKYGENCYQKNPMHHQKFRHPNKNQTKPCTAKIDTTIAEDQKENLSADCNITTQKDKHDETDIGPPASKKSRILEDVEQPICDKEVYKILHSSI